MELSQAAGLELSPVTQDALDDLCQWWLEVQEDEMFSPEWHDVGVIFNGVDYDELIPVLRSHPEAMTRAAAAAALGALEYEAGFFPLMDARGDTDDMVRVFAASSCGQIDDWYGLYDVWDFLLLACEVYQTQCEVPRQLTLF